MVDILIQNGKILDGTGNPWIQADLAISKGNIELIQKSLNIPSVFTIDAQGLFVAPGFIDMHTHWDLRVFQFPEEEEKLKQGITTSLIGQDGLSVAPISNSSKKAMMERVSGLLGSYLEEWSWNTVEEYLVNLATLKPATNYMMLVPHGNLRASVLGWENRAATKQEISKMQDLLTQAMKQGACGFSTGLIYPPGMFADRRELVRLCKTTGENDGFFVVHMRDEGNYLLDSIREVADICLEADCPLHISHLKVAGKDNWGKSTKAIQLLEEFRSSGLDVTFDQYPYIAGSTMLDALIPPRFHSGGSGQLLKNLKNRNIRDEIRQVIEGELSERWENWVSHCGWNGILINSVSSEANKFTEGKTLSEIAQITGQSPFESMCELLLSENGGVTMTQFYGSEEDVRIIMQSDYMTLCTDAIVGGKPHPRAYGSTIRFLEKYVRQEGVLTLPQAVSRMTSRPAQRLGLKDRGILKEKMVADITIFDYQELHEKGTFQDPNQYPEGIKYVLVNGEIAINNGLTTGKRNGKIIIN